MYLVRLSLAGLKTSVGKDWIMIQRHQESLSGKFLSGSEMGMSWDRGVEMVKGF